MKKNILFLIIGFFLGIIIIGQIKTLSFYPQIKSNSQKELIEKIIISGKEINSNKIKLKELEEKNKKYKDSLNNQQNSYQLIKEEIKNYQKFLGQEELSGRGVEIFINHNMNMIEMIDFVNNLKNIGVKGISLNNKRLVLNSYFKEEGENLFLVNYKISPPYLFKVIGDPEALKYSLERGGGILERLGRDFKLKTEIKTNNYLILPPN